MPANSYRDYDPMPDEDLLDEIAQSIAKCKYDDLGPDHRAIVFDLAIKAEHAAFMQPISEWCKLSKLWEG